MYWEQDVCKILQKAKRMDEHACSSDQVNVKFVVAEEKQAAKKRNEMDGINIDRLAVIKNRSDVVKDQWPGSETTEL